MIAAQEARKKTLDQLAKAMNIELANVDEQINKAIAAGKFSLYGDGGLSVEVQRKLRELGYTVQTGCQYNESYYTVSWEVK